MHKLPRRLVDFFREQGCDVIHTLSLPEGNYTQDSDVIRYADMQQRIVVSKDADFVNSFLLLFLSVGLARHFYKPKEDDIKTVFILAREMIQWSKQQIPST